MPETARESTHFPVDRGAAFVRGAWRALAALLLGGVARLLLISVNWPLMWRTDAISCAAMAGVMALLIAPLLLATVSALLWFLLAMWPAPVGATLSRSTLSLRFGPFGSASLDRPRATVEGPPGDIPARLADEWPLRITHPAYSGNVADAIQQFTRATTAALCATLLAHGWQIPEDGEE